MVIPDTAQTLKYWDSVNHNPVGCWLNDVRAKRAGPG